jgi:hypothetical protein
MNIVGLRPGARGAIGQLLLGLDAMSSPRVLIPMAGVSAGTGRNPSRGLGRAR